MPRNSAHKRSPQRDGSRNFDKFRREKGTNPRFPRQKYNATLHLQAIHPEVEEMAWDRSNSLCFKKTHSKSLSPTKLDMIIVKTHDAVTVCRQSLLRRSFALTMRNLWTTTRLSGGRCSTAKRSDELGAACPMLKIELPCSNSKRHDESSTVKQRSSIRTGGKSDLPRKSVISELLETVCKLHTLQTVPTIKCVISGLRSKVGRNCFVEAKLKR
jgi:hypothetical protein